MTDIPDLNETLSEADMRINICREKRSRTLDLSDIGLADIPESVKELRYLEVLKLNENTLSVLPDFICSLKDLVHLDLGYNRLSSLPQSIGELSYLKNLNVRCNKLRSIPESIGKLASLCSLDISYNSLSELPETINNLPNLEFCDIRGNNLRGLSERISDLNKPKKTTMLGHVERIVELTGKNDLSGSQFFGAKLHVNYVAQKLRITQVQAVLFSHIVSVYEESPVSMQEIAQSIGCSKIKLIQNMDDFEELERKKLIRPATQTRRRWGQSSEMPSYRISKEVMLALMKDEEYQPLSCSNLPVTELFIRMESLFEQRVGDQEISYSELSAEISELLDSNRQLPFVDKMYGYELSKTDMMLLLRFCHLYINRDDDEIDFNKIAAMYDHHSDFNMSQRQFRTGEHILMTRGFIEFANNDGFENRELFKLTDMIKTDLLAELKIKALHNSKEIIQVKSINEKRLFYNDKEGAQVKQLFTLLEANAFREIQSRLSGSGMRTGFACLFSGPPGTGKTETVYQLAKQTNRNIMAVDISQTKSMWFGQSEKKIKETFKRYRDYVDDSEITPILLFNEADAVFSKRKDVSSSSVAQTENAIQNIILQELENLKGILIATTNMTDNLDKAFERRFLYKIDFGKPDLQARQSIWQSAIPGLSCESARTLASRFDFSGGQIENIARKRTVEFVLSGTEPDLDKLMLFCGEELISKYQPGRIGFQA